ncbi:hypothetical protein ABIB95_007311 [Bradyrhizobium sp. LA2.1]
MSRRPNQLVGGGARSGIEGGREGSRTRRNSNSASLRPASILRRRISSSDSMMMAATTRRSPSRRATSSSTSPGRRNQSARPSYGGVERAGRRCPRRSRRARPARQPLRYRRPNRNDARGDDAIFQWAASQGFSLAGRPRDVRQPAVGLGDGREMAVSSRQAQRVEAIEAAAVRAANAAIGSRTTRLEETLKGSLKGYGKKLDRAA